ncbi:MAG: PIN domain-containing protein [Prosthecobacter sp.]|nr:PIN domain-containing protein [Prosthecobacter sp.]
MIRAVLDTNVLLTALRSRHGASFEIVSRFRKGEFALLIGNTVLSEYDEVLKREGPSFGLATSTVDRFLDALCAGAEEFRTSTFWKPSLPDPDDEAFAQLALEAKVGYLVTHNRRHFPADRLPALKVVTPKEFLNVLQAIVP